MEIRKAVLGAEYVETSPRTAGASSQRLQELVTSYCCGAVWGGDGLPHTMRSLLNVALLMALNRPQELKLNIPGALRNGCTRDEGREVLHQAAVYCGVPAAVAAFRSAKEAFAALDEENAANRAT